MLAHLAIFFFYFKTKYACHCEEGIFLSTDTKANSYSCVKGSEVLNTIEEKEAFCSYDELHAIFRREIRICAYPPRNWSPQAGFQEMWCQLFPELHLCGPSEYNGVIWGQSLCKNGLSQTHQRYIETLGPKSDLFVSDLSFIYIKVYQFQWMNHECIPT